MACPSTDLMLDYVERRVRSDERDEVEEHVDRCSACRELTAELARITAFDRPPSAPSDDPKRIARYRIESRLGEGGMGTVYVAYDPELDRRVALKLVHPELTQLDAVERLLREGRTLARLTHPNIVTVYDAGTDDDRVYIAMELVEGDTLSAWLDSAPRHWREIVTMFVAIGHGLAAAHRTGVVHRDVKPDNVLVARNGDPKVVDFGLAGGVPTPNGEAPDPISRITQEGTVLGTPAFMSPEQWNGSDVGPATDQYSLCAALRDALGTRARPAWIDRAIERGTANDPRARFSSMTALADALDPDRRARRRRTIAIAIAAPMLLASIASVALLRSPAPHALEASCRTAAAERAALWSPIDRVAVRSSIQATGLSWANQLWARTDRNMTKYLAIVADAEAQTCAAAPRTPAALDTAKLALACLSESRTAVRTLTQRLHAVTANDVRGGLRRWFGLPEPQECTNEAFLHAQREVDSHATSSLLGDRMKRALAEARRADERGDSDEAVALARQAVDHAKQLGDPYLARALLGLGDRLFDTDLQAAEQAYRDALAATERASLDVMRVDAMLQLMKALGKQPGRERELFDLAPLVTAAANRAHKDTKAAPPVHRLLGMAHDRLGNHAEAIHHLEQALDLARARHKNPFDTRLIKYLMTLAEALERADRRGDADTLIEEALRLSEAVQGTEHEETQRLIAARNRAKPAR
ncbi:MAG TPA: protein kinase [Kofleriaceae bacterium]